MGRGKKQRGDGTREELEAIARGAGVFLVVGAVERVGGSLYCAVVYVCPREGCLGKRRKVMPVSRRLSGVGGFFQWRERLGVRNLRELWLTERVLGCAI